MALGTFLRPCNHHWPPSAPSTATGGPGHKPPPGPPPRHAPPSFLTPGGAHKLRAPRTCPPWTCPVSGSTPRGPARRRPATPLTHREGVWGTATATGPCAAGARPGSRRRPLAGTVWKRRTGLPGARVSSSKQQFRGQRGRLVIYGRAGGSARPDVRRARETLVHPPRGSAASRAFREEASSGA